MSSAVLPPGFENPITPTTKITIDSVLFNNLKSIGQNIWQSPGGIIYGPGSRHGHRITYIFEHASPDLNKNSYENSRHSKKPVRTSKLTQCQKRRLASGPANTN